MGKISIRHMRRAEISQAAYEVLVEHGTRSATLERVAKRAGVSKGVVLHHFKDKDVLFEGVMRRANTLLRDSVIELLQHANTPHERLAAIVVGNFADPVFRPQVCHAWICLCADVPYNPQLRRIQTVIHRRMKSNLLVALRQIGVGDAEVAADQVRVSIDGIWVQASTRLEPMTSEEGTRLAVNAIAMALGGADRDALSEAIEKMEGIAAIVLRSKAYTQRISVGR